MSLPSTFMALVLVSQPVTQSTWPVSTGDMSAPMRDDLHVLVGDLVLGEQRAQQDDAGRLDADLLADQVLRLADRVLLQREERVRVLLRAGREAHAPEYPARPRASATGWTTPARPRSAPPPPPRRRRCSGRRPGSAARCLPARSSRAPWRTPRRSGCPTSSQPSCMLTTGLAWLCASTLIRPVAAAAPEAFQKTAPIDLEHRALLSAAPRSRSSGR